MSQVSSQNLGGSSFEFDSLEAAVHYRASILREIGPHVRGRVLEAGAGVGHFSGALARCPGVERFVALEPEEGFRKQFRLRHPTLEVCGGTVAALPGTEAWDTIVSINVLEHIEDDEGELRRYCELLAGRRGHLCLLVPARKELYAPIDRDFGHYRRYNRRELLEKLERSGFHGIRLHYFNGIGYFAWWLGFRMLRKRAFNRKMVALFDQLVFPWALAFERRFIRPPFGQSLLAVGQAR